jgi:hypothetical protein
MNTRFQTEEFFSKAKELGLVDDIDRQLEDRKNVQRLAILEKMKALPPIEKTELPALGKAATAAHKALELAEEAHRAADRNYKELSVRVYSMQLRFEGARLALEREAKELAPDFLRTAWEDARFLDDLVGARFQVEIGTEYSSWHDRFVPTATSNHDAILACRKNIKEAQDRFLAMMLVDIPRAKAQEEVAATFVKLEDEAYALGVMKSKFEARRTPVDVIAKAEEHAAREQKERARQGEVRRSQLATIHP